MCVFVNRAYIIYNNVKQNIFQNLFKQNKNLHIRKVFQMIIIKCTKSSTCEFINSIRSFFSLQMSISFQDIPPNHKRSSVPRNTGYTILYHIITSGFRFAGGGE